MSVSQILSSPFNNCGNASRRPPSVCPCVKNEGDDSFALCEKPSEMDFPGGALGSSLRSACVSLGRFKPEVGLCVAWPSLVCLCRRLRAGPQFDLFCPAR